MSSSGRYWAESVTNYIGIVDSYTNQNQSEIDTITYTIGKIEPIPQGCLSMEFFSPSDDSMCIRTSGLINGVITPAKREEPLQKQWSLDEFEKSIFKTNIFDDSFSNYLPGTNAWNYLKKHLKPGDDIWTFGLLDTGFIIVRDGKVICLVVTNHHW